MGKCECGRLKGNPCGPLRPNTINVTMPSLPLKGYIMNHPMPSADPATKTNSETLARLTDVPCVGSIPHLSLSADSEGVSRSLLAVFNRHVNLGQILG